MLPAGVWSSMTLPRIGNRPDVPKHLGTSWGLVVGTSASVSFTESLSFLHSPSKRSCCRVASAWLEF